MMREQRQVYLDHSASTPVDARVLQAMRPFFSDVYGNSSSAHQGGRAAERAVEAARERVAALLHCQPAELVFTGGGSESDNLAIRGAAWRSRQLGRSDRLITSPVEHSAVTQTIHQLDSLMGFTAEFAPVDRAGLVDAAAFAAACRRGGAVASVIYANNELGSINDLARLSRIARGQGVLFHSDAVQAGGQLTLDVGALGVDMLSLSAHKFYGPKGVGILYIREGVELVSAITGGGHERGQRAGTHNTAGIVGLAKALELAHEEHAERTERFSRLRDRLVTGVLQEVSGAQLSGHPERRLPSHASFVLPGIDANALLMHLDMRGIAASSGSACKVGDPAPSAILLAVGYSPTEARCGLRLSVGMSTTPGDIDYAVEALADAAKKLRSLYSKEPARENVQQLAAKPLYD
ncbi:MAG: cysteine desulfurase family protein [Chloroflexi bacterium]|nr:cysteine desulfurase family protein [Chloroflexota bacterium]MCY4246286.1 cysteine desulfurase family protein [Chloroflexota bacterium]